MKGRQVLIEPLPGGGDAAALLVDGRLEDLLIDADAAIAGPQPEAVYLARSGRPMKGLGGTMMDLGAGLSGFLRGAAPPPGRLALVQITATAEAGKAPPVSTRLLIKGRFALLSPGAPGRNVARSIRDPEARAGLARLAEAAMDGADGGLGLVLRSAAAGADPDAVTAEIAGLRRSWAELSAGATGSPGFRRAAPGAAEIARRDWLAPGDAVREAPDALAGAGVWEAVEALRGAHVRLAAGSMFIEPTHALTAVDVNTGGGPAQASPLAANLAAARDLPRQLRLRGLGGTITIDFAPLAKHDRHKVEAALAAALAADDIATSIVGWTPLGHLELQRQRLRRPLAYRGTTAHR